MPTPATPARRRRTALPALVAAAVLLAAAGCGDDPAPGQGGGQSGGQGAADPMSEPALRYGLPPVPDPAVTYQPDVVIVAGGGASVRSVTDDGLTWRIDPRAGQAKELAPGKVMFVTGRGVGRVVEALAAVAGQLVHHRHLRGVSGGR